MREREKRRKRQNERVNWMFSHPNARGFHPCSFREWRSRRRFREGIFLLPCLPDRCPKTLPTMSLNETVAIEGVGSVCLRAGFNQKAIPRQGAKVALCWRSSEWIAQSSKLRKKIKKIFNAKAIPPWWRDRIPIAIDENELIAIGTLKNANLNLVDESGFRLEWCPRDGIWSESKSDMR